MFGDAFVNENGICASFEKLVDGLLHVGYAWNWSHGYAMVHWHYNCAVVALHDSF
jgi:hypothetical protein